LTEPRQTHPNPSPHAPPLEAVTIPGCAPGADGLALAAVAQVRSGMVVGMGTGRTAARAVRALAHRYKEEKLDIDCVSTSAATETLAKELGLPTVPFADIELVDYLFDGANEVDFQLRMLKGHHGAITRQRLVAEVSKRCVYLAAEDKLVQRSATLPTSSPVSNERFNGVAYRSFGIFLLCRSVDVYNWYCRETLKLALKTDPIIIASLQKAESRIAREISKAVKQQRNPVDALTKLLDGKSSMDWAVRDAVHERLNVVQDPETELICLCRNVLVHRRGYDEFDQVAEALKNLGTKRAQIYSVAHPAGHMPISLGPNRLLTMDGNVGLWACDFLHNQIHLMDQNFSHVYKLPTKRWRPRPIGRAWIGGTDA